ncbi:hypothetical protein BGZ60DRAFT_405797 [Tricladium varicosporioides]|nr:hypothetical protein BGZ60DRAFT_405797 [Hymenoscyphus varicosporioides]
MSSKSPTKISVLALPPEPLRMFLVFSSFFHILHTINVLFVRAMRIVTKVVSVSVVLFIKSRVVWGFIMALEISHF